MGGCMPKLSVEGSRHKWCVRTDDFVCDGTMFRHTEVSWEDAPVEFKRSHQVEASQGAPVRSMNYEHMIEDLMPFDCHVYWEPVWEKCPACHKADQGFKAWATRASTPAALAAQKKRKAAQADDANGQGKTKAQKVVGASSSSSSSSSPSPCSPPSSSSSSSASAAAAASASSSSVHETGEATAHEGTSFAGPTMPKTAGATL